MSEIPQDTILSSDISRKIGKDAQRNNILAARIISDIVKTTLGPKGMDKMLVDSSGNITITNDGVTILEELEIEHPASKMMVEIAKTQEREVGDGTTSAVLLAGKLLEYGEILLDKKIHPTIIVKGYELASKKSLELLEEISINFEGRELLEKIAQTSMTGKGAEGHREHLSKILVDAIFQVSSMEEIQRENINIQKLKGESVSDSEVIKGVVFEKERAHKDMPLCVVNPKILLIDFPLENKSPESEVHLNISTPEQLQRFIEREEYALKELIENIIQNNASVVFCQKGIDDVAQYYLAKAGILACRRVPRSDMERISRATSAKIISHINELKQEVFGRAETAEEVLHRDTSLLYIRGCTNPKSVSIIIRGGTTHVVDEIERALNDAIGDCVSALKSKKVVAGGGAVEMELSKRLKVYSRTLEGREQLAVEQFALALESIPLTLAENAGLDPLDIMTELSKAHDLGKERHGINLFTNKIEDTFLAGIIEPAQIKRQAISSASEVASLILRIDDVLMSKGKKKEYEKSSDDLD